MADQPVETVAPAAEPTPTLSEPDNRNPELKDSGLPPPQPLFTTLPPNQGLNPSTPQPQPQPPIVLFPPSSVQPYHVAPSFRPAAPSLPQFAPLPVSSNPNLPQAPSYSTSNGLPPPGVNAVPTGPMGAAGQVPAQLSMPLSMPPPPYAALRPPYAQLPNGYPAIPQTSPFPGMARYPPQFALLRPPFPRPGTIAFMPQFSRPPALLARPTILPPIIRPLPTVTPAEKMQITVYIGKISPTVENDFMLSLLQLCGPVKGWKRPQDPTNGTLKSFGLYEFEFPEGVLRALRLLSKLCIDGQELVVNVNKAARDYLERCIAKKLESYKSLKETDGESTNKNVEDMSNDKNNGAANSSSEIPNPLKETTVKDGGSTAKSENTYMDFGLVSEEDRQADQEALDKIKGMIEERLKNKPLPPPPARTTDDAFTNSKDGESDIDVTKDAAEDKNENEMNIDQDRSEISSPDRDRKLDRRRDRERDVKREKERELERYEREREQDRAKREKDRDHRIREDERRYKAREKEWEVREKEKEQWRKREKEREKDWAHERKLEVLGQERESQDGYIKKRKYRSNDDDRRKRQQREKEEDLADRLKEEEIIETTKKAEEELQKKHEEELNTVNKDIPVEKITEMEINNHAGDQIMQNGVGDESIIPSLDNTEARNNANASSRKLGFGLLGVGKRTSVPSVFEQDEEEDAHKEKKMRPLVPIDYSTEEHLADQPSASSEASEFAKRISGVVPKEEKYDMEKERNKRSNDRHGHRDKDRNTFESSRGRDEIKKENHARDHDKVKTPDNQKLLDAKQLIDMIPKTKDELFSYEINWDTYDQNALQERMKPWISKKITEFLGEEEPTLVDYIVSSTREHVKAMEMLERLSGILDEEAEMFVLKMWRMLIFEIKRVETGLALRSRS